MTEQELQLLAGEVRRLQDAQAIQNLISTTSYMFAIGEYSTIYGFFAKTRDDITAQVASSGKKTGHEAVRALLVDTFEQYAKNHAEHMSGLFPEDDTGEGRNGLLDLRALASPIIEVAGDRRTAKGLWLIPGTQTFADGAALPVAHWVWTKLAVDLINEDGKWRIWHLLSVPCFASAYDRSWVDAAESGDEYGIIMSNPYTVHSSYPHPPAPPKPYRTFTETFSY